MPLIDITVFYVQMFERPDYACTTPREGLSVVHVRCPAIDYYRSLYNAVGEPYHWRSRGRLSDAELTAILHDPLDEMHVLQLDGKDAGFAELDRRQPGQVEIVQFGLRPEYVGQGLGPWFLRQIVNHCWSLNPERVWLHTCTEDHPAALPMYLKAGFQQFKQEQIQRTLP